jgi:chromosome segregation ATPase
METTNNTPTNETAIARIITESGIEKETAKPIEQQLAPFYEQTAEWKQRAYALVITNETQYTEMAQARTARLALQKIRTGADKVRKALKAESTRYGNAVQQVYNAIEAEIKPIEEHLLEQEQYVQKQQEKRQAELRAKRTEETKPYAEYIPAGMDLGIISDQDYLLLLNGAKLHLQERIRKEDEQRKAEADRLAKEAADKAERERKAEEERKANEAKRAELEKEIAERKAEADKRAAENDRLAKEAKEAREKAQALEAANSKLQKKVDKLDTNLTLIKGGSPKIKGPTDQDKMRELAAMIARITIPTGETPHGIATFSAAKQYLAKLIGYLDTQAKATPSPKAPEPEPQS